MDVLSYYLVIAVTVSTAAFLAAEWLRTPDVAAPRHPGAMALAAGLLWPFVAAGIVQLAAVVAVSRNHPADAGTRHAADALLPSR
jgi:hypothetical protein